MIAFGEWIATTPLSVFIKSHLWVTPLLQSIHILVIGVVFIAVLMIALRVLGHMRTDEPFEAVWKRFSPWLWYGLVVMLATGIVLTVGEPVREFTAFSFWLKMSLIVIAVTTATLFGRSVRPAAQQGNAEFSSAVKLGATATIAVWVAIMFLGRAIAYDVEVWGSLHLG